jgi:hypothetical protein
MDDEALRLNTSNLKSLVRLRTVRERQALRDLRAALAERDEAAGAHRRAERALRRDEAARQERETHMYRTLPTRGPLTGDALAGHEAQIARWSEVVRSAAGRLDEARVALDEAEEAARGARARYAARARALRKWERVQDLATAAGRRWAEAAGERESEDEIGSRPRGAPASLRARP